MADFSFCGKVPRKILQANPRQNPPKFVQQIPDTFLQRGQAKNLTPHCLAAVFDSRPHPNCPLNVPPKLPLSFTREIYMAEASFSAYLSGINLLKTGENLHFSKKKTHTHTTSSFLSLPFSLVCLKMAKLCCFCLSRGQKSRQKTRPPPYIYIYIYIERERESTFSPCKNKSRSQH